MNFERAVTYIVKNPGVEFVRVDECGPLFMFSLDVEDEHVHFSVLPKNERGVTQHFSRTTLTDVNSMWTLVKK